MIIQAELRRKQSEYEGEACSVDKVIELPAQRFKQFSRALLADYDFIAENKNAIRHDEDARHCLLILDADGTDGFLVDPQGYNYARYSAFVPNARSLLTPDMGIDRSYLSSAEPWRNENQDEMLRMTLRVNGKPDYTLVLPADEEYLDAVKAYPENWQRHSYVACCGTSIQPVLQMLEQVPQLDTILLCLDNDEAGHQASRRMREQLEMRYSVERLIPENKDWNDDLTLSGENAQGFSMNEMR